MAALAGSRGVERMRVEIDVANHMKRRIAALQLPTPSPDPPASDTLNVLQHRKQRNAQDEHRHGQRISPIQGHNGRDEAW